MQSQKAWRFCPQDPPRPRRFGLSSATMGNPIRILRLPLPGTSYRLPATAERQSPATRFSTRRRVKRTGPPGTTPSLASTAPPRTAAASHSQPRTEISSLFSRRVPPTSTASAPSTTPTAQPMPTPQAKAPTTPMPMQARWKRTARGQTPRRQGPTRLPRAFPR